MWEAPKEDENPIVKEKVNLKKKIQKLTIKNSGKHGNLRHARRGHEYVQGRAHQIQRTTRGEEAQITVNIENI